MKQIFAQSAQNSFAICRCIIPVIIYGSSFFIWATLFIPDILNIMMPLDEPRLRTLPTPIECFVDQQKYFYVIVSDVFIIALAGITTILATETMFMVVIQHICGLLAIARYKNLDNLVLFNYAFYKSIIT